MKRILGSLFLIVSFIYGYEIEISNKNPFVKEPVLIKSRYVDKKYKEIEWLNFEPKKSKDYEFYLLQKSSKDGDFRFSYLLFPLKSKKVKLEFLLKIKRAPIEEIEYKILGTGYEQTKPVEGKIYNIDIKPEILDVKDAKDVDLYGDFVLNMSIDKKEASKYEPVYVKISLKGIGYPPKMDNLLNEIKGVKILKDKPIKKVSYKKNGAKIEYVFNYAIVADRDFTIPKIELKEFDFKNYKKLKSRKFFIKVKKGEELVDDKNEPKRLTPFYKEILDVVKYIFIFISGGIFGVLLYLLFRKKSFEEILLAKDKRELLSLLVVRYPNCLEEIKNRLDESIVKDKDINLLNIKKEIIKELKRGCK